MIYVVRYLSCVFFSCCIFLSNNIFCQGAANESMYTDTLAEVQVATRKPEKAFLLPYSLTNINRTELEHTLPRSLPEALSIKNGVFVQKTNHGGGSPFLRGLTGNQVLAMLDGIRLNNATYRYGPNQYLNTIDLFTINNVEIIRGSGSVQYGSDAMGGVIYLQTRDPLFADEKNKLSSSFTGRYMTQDMEKTARTELAYGSKKIAILAGYSFKDFGDMYGGDTTRKQTPSGYRENAFNAKVLLALPADWSLKLAHQSLMQSHVPVYHKIVLENYFLNEMHPQNKRISYAMLSKNFSLKYLRKLNFTLSAQQSLEERRMQKNGSNTLAEETDKVNTYGAVFEMIHQFNTHWSANSGVEMYMDKVRSGKTEIDKIANTSIAKRGLYPDGARYNNLSVYTLHQYAINKWYISGGVRYNKNFSLIKDEALGNVKINPQALVADIGVLFKTAMNSSLYGNVSTGYRAPNIDDMGSLGIVDFRYELPAYHLRPEYNYNYELGFKHHSKVISLTASAFYSSLKNLITRVRVDGKQINGYNVYQKENAENGYIRGFEAFAVCRPLDVVQFSAQISYQQGWNQTKEEPLRRIPPFFGSLSAKYFIRKFSVSTEYLSAAKQDRLAQGDKDDNRIPHGGTPAWNIVNLYAGYAFNKYFSLHTSLQNIFNQDYRMHGSGINGVGRSAVISLKVNSGG